MRKSIIRFIAVFMVLIIIAVTPVVLSLFAKKSDSISLTVINGSSSEKIEAYPSYQTSQEFVDEMTLIAENSRYRFYLHESLAAIALFDKSQNAYYFSNPYDVESNGSDTETTKNRQRSQIFLTYYDDENNSMELNSFNDCISKKQFTVDSIENGVKIKMMLGEAGEQYLIPEIMSGKMFKSILAGIAEEGKYSLEDAYQQITVNGVSEEVAKQLLEEYPYLKTDDLYKVNALSNRIKKQLSTLLETSGLTHEQITAEYQKIGYEKDEKTPAFTLTVQYQLDNDGLRVSVPMDSISYQSKYFQLDSISILPYFGYGSISETSGELLIPDGSGTILKYNNNLSKRLTGLSMPVYGQDAASVSDHSEKSTSKQIRMPVFGNKSQNGSYLAVIEDGESICSVTASSGDSSDRYPTAYVTAQYRYNELFFYNDKDFSKNVMAYADTYNKGTVSVKYIPLKAGSNYVDMAFAYKDYLIDKGSLQKQEIAPRLILQMLGYCNNENGNFSLTTFDDAARMIRELKDVNVNDMAVRYLGWTSGGLNNYYVDKITLDSIMGGKDGWNQLKETADQQDTEIFLDTDLSFVRRTTWFDRFSANFNGCRNIRNQLCGVYEYNYGDSNIDKSRLINGVSSRKILNDVNGLYNSFCSKVGAAKISVGSLGNTLNSTFKSGHVVTRQEAENQITDVLKKLATSDKLMLENANAFALPYCSNIVNLDVTSSSFDSTDYDVPFYQLVVNGCIEYCALPFNESESTRDALLKAFETGSGISYVVAYRNQNQLKKSTQSDYYSVRYNVVKDEIKETYDEYKSVMDKIGDAVIADHRSLATDVFLTTYSNGTKIAVNYGNQAYSFESGKVEPKGYLIIEGSD